MTDRGDALQQYVHRQQGEKLRAVIHQIDTLSHLLLKMYEADFVGIFYHNSPHQVMLPVSYQHWEGQGLVDLELLEKQWLRNVDKLGSLDKREFVAATQPEFWANDPFAEKNEFSHHLRYPIYESGTLRGVVLVYWRKKHAGPDQPPQMMKPLMQLLLKAIEILEHTHLMDTVIIRLSTVLRLFNTNLARDDYDSVLDRVSEAATQLFPKAGVLLAVPEKGTARLQVVRRAGAREVPPGYAEAVCAALVEKFAVADSDANEQPRRLEIESRFGLARTLAVPLCPKQNHRCALVLFAEKERTLTDSDLELLTVFRMFAEAVLANSLVVRDLTKSNALIRESSDRLADLESLAAVADMTSGIAHRLNNVIGGITGRLQLMQVKTTDKATLKQLELLEDMANEGAQTIRRIQEFATATRATDHEPISLRDTLTAYRDQDRHPWQELAGKRQVEVKYIIPDRSALLDSSPGDITTILDLLIQNAVEFAPEDSEVTVALEVETHRYTLAVIDRGPGVPEMVQKKIFFPFFSTKQGRDAGMGLAMVHALAVKHGGTVSFESEPNEATAFYVRFDLAGAREDTDKIVAKHSPKSDELRILIVDDDPQLRDVLNDMLSLDGHEVVSCNDAYAALEQVKGGDFDMMITDLGMPGMSGLDLAGEVHEKHPELPIAMITGWGTQLNNDEVSLRGIRRVLAKPFHLRDIKSLIKELRA